MKKAWEKKKLGDVCEFFNGKAHEKVIDENGKYKVINSKFISTDGTKYKKTNSLLFPLRKDDITMVMSDVPNGKALAKCFLVDEDNKYTLNQRICAIRSDQFIEKFLYYQLNRNEYFLRFNNGENQTNLRKSDILNCELYVPTKDEQQDIVTTLDNAFEAIDKAKKNSKKNLINAKEVFDSYLNNIFTNPGDDWEIKKLGEVCERVEYGSSSKSKKEGSIPVVRMGNIQNGVLVWDNLVYSDNQKDNENYLLKYNDVLFNRTNSIELVGKTAIYKGEMPAIFAGYLIRIHRNEDFLDANYLNYYLNSQVAMEYGRSIATSSVNQANINGTKLKNYTIPLPPLKEQRKIVAKLGALSAETKKLEAIYRKKLANLDELKKSIIKKVFNGEL